MLYFAFGSNMDLQQMHTRVGDTPPPQSAKLSQYILVFDKFSKTRNCGAANLLFTGKKEDYVEGLLYLLTENQVAILDELEGIHSNRPGRYERKEVLLEDGIKAFTYIAQAELALTGSTALKPSITYLKHLYAGKSYLSEPYYHSLLSISPMINAEQQYLQRCVRYGLQKGAIKALMQPDTRIEDWMVMMVQEPSYQQSKPKSYAALHLITCCYRDYKHEYARLNPDEIQVALMMQIKAENWHKALSLVALGGHLSSDLVSSLHETYSDDEKFSEAFKPFIRACTAQSNAKELVPKF